MGGSKDYPWEASVDTPRLPPLRQDCVRQNRDQRLQQGQGADATRRPVPIMDQSGLTKNIYWAQSGPYWTSHGPLTICRGTNCRLQLWGETAMKWSQAICASILVDEFYLLSLHARSNLRSDRYSDEPGAPLEPALKPILFTADWRLPPRPVRTKSPKPQADVS